MTRIFISYRREDAAGHAGRLCDRLTESLGDRQVFMDVESIPPGEDFPRVIESRIADCSAALVVIGPRWLKILQERSGGVDFVRQEIACALRRGVKTIPILVGGAEMPGRASLPEDIAGLSRHNALQLHDDQFDSGVEYLLQSLYDLSRPATLNGEWICEMTKPGQAPYRVRLNLQTLAGRVIGTVVYPSGQAVIRNGAFTPPTLSFATSHIPQFSSEPATIQFDGEMSNDELRLVSVDDNGVASGVAHKVST